MARQPQSTAPREVQPDKWSTFRLGEKYFVRYGRANPGGKGIVPVVGSSGIFSWTSRPLISHPTIVIGRKGTAGKPWLIKDPCHPSDTAFYLEPRDASGPDLEFIYYALCSVQPEASTDVIPSLQRHELEGLEVPLPPFSEQRAIAAVLSKIQTAVEIQGKIVQMLKALRESTLPKIVLGAHQDQKRKETPIGKIPSHWELIHLKDVAVIARGRFGHRPRNEPRFYGGSVPFIQTGDVARSNGRIRRHSQTLNEEGLAISKLFPKGTIVLTIAANIGETGILEFDSAFPDSLVGITPDSTLNPAFLEYYLRTQKAEMNRLAPKGTQKNINVQFLLPWPVPRPPLEEQREIVRCLRAIDDRLEVALKRRDALGVLFSSTLNALLNGRLRIREDVK